MIKNSIDEDRFDRSEAKNIYNTTLKILDIYDKSNFATLTFLANWDRLFDKVIQNWYDRTNHQHALYDKRHNE
jgi:hypothetical protein